MDCLLLNNITKISSYSEKSIFGQISIVLPEKNKDQTINIEVIDINGKLVFKQSITHVNEAITLNLGAQLSNGLYRIRMNTAEGSYWQKVILQR